MNCKTGIVGLLIVKLGFAGNAMALAPPSACRSPEAQRGYQSGITHGQFLVKAMRRSAQQSRQVAGFAKMLENKIHHLSLPPSPTKQAACRYVGMGYGMIAEVKSSLASYNLSCREEGEIIGRMAGKMFCDLAIAFHGVAFTQYLDQPPVHSCGRSFINGCKCAFSNFAKHYNNIAGQCRKYTSPPFCAHFHQTLHNQCRFSDP